MTAPTEPTPGAPAPAPVPVPTPPAAATPAPEPTNTGATPEPAFDPSALTPAAQAYLKAQIDAADLKARTGSKANAAAEARRELTAQLAATLGLAGDQPPNPEDLQRHLEEAREQAWARQIQLDLYRAVGPDAADQLLDSRRFIESLDDLDGEPGTPAFSEALKVAAQAAAAKFPASAGQAPGGPRPDPTQGTRGTGPDSNSLIAAAKAKGDWRTVISLENAKLSNQ